MVEKVISPNIISLGVEIEGGLNERDLKNFENFIEELSKKNWKPYHERNGYPSINERYERDTDGSIKNIDKELPHEEILFWTRDLNELFKVVTYLYEGCYFETNESCGLHVHLKVNGDIYKKLSFTRVQNLFAQRYREFSESQNKPYKYIRRYDGAFSQIHTDENTIIGQLDENEDLAEEYRYHMINFASINKHGTLEIRILPAVDNIEEFKKGIHFIINTFEKVVTTTKVRKLREYEIKIKMPKPTKNLIIVNMGDI